MRGKATQKTMEWAVRRNQREFFFLFFLAKPSKNERRKKIVYSQKNENKRNEKQRLKGNGMKTRVGWKPRGSSDEAE